MAKSKPKTPPAKRSSATATKEDIALILVTLTKMQAHMATKEYVDGRLERIETQMLTKEYLDRRLTEERAATKAEMHEMEQRLIRHFGVVAENIKHDFRGAFHDKLGQHGDRITRLEQHVQLR